MKNNIERYKWKKNIKIKHQKILANKIGVSEFYLSKIVNRHLTCPKRTALVIANGIDENRKLEDFFEKV